MLKILPILAFKDNYIWCGINDQNGHVFIIDPGDASPVFDFLNQNNFILTDILVTHKHADHTGGIRELVHAYPNIAVYAHPIEQVSSVTHHVEQDASVLIKGGPTFKVIHIPGHTLGHVAYYAEGILFSGDTLFGAGCGRVFEGTAEQMLSSLNKLAALPDDTLIYCGHEYTLANLAFASVVEPTNKDIQQRIKVTEKLRLENTPTLPSTMGLEKKTNPFLRVGNAVDVFHELREWKNRF